MKITISQFTPYTPDATINAAERWLRKEATELTPTRGFTPGGLQYVGVEQLIDGIEITTRFSAEEVEGGSHFEFRLRMRGVSMGSKIRNLGMLPMIRIVRNASIEQFQDILDELESSQGGTW